MQAAVGISQRGSNGLKQSKQKTAQYCFYKHPPLPTKWRIKRLLWEGEVCYYTKTLVDPMGARMPLISVRLGAGSSFSPQMALKSLEATTAHQLCRASAAQAGQSHLP